MLYLNNKKILIGISGGIAAYKAAELTRALIKSGAQVRVVMTPSACAFITPLTLQALSGNPVAQSLLDPHAQAGMSHIELAKWADLIIIAPATANLIARLSIGMANDLLSSICLASEAPIAIAPAMNHIMYTNLATQANIATLKERGYTILGPASGQQACGDEGSGRMVEPLAIAQALNDLFMPKALANLNIIVTAGPTREAIDPVRYLSNYSSGKMGYAIAQVAALQGAKVTLISGPTNLDTPDLVNKISVESALDMHACVHAELAKACDIFISCAAVADFRCENILTNKFKKQNKDDALTIKFTQNPDILASVANLDNKHRPFCIGFAAETENVEQYALRKLKQKNIDLICANDVSIADQGFNADKNALHLFWSDGDKKLALNSKYKLAQELIAEIISHYRLKHNA